MHKSSKLFLTIIIILALAAFVGSVYFLILFSINVQIVNDKVDSGLRNYANVHLLSFACASFYVIVWSIFRLTRAGKEYDKEKGTFYRRDSAMLLVISSFILGSLSTITIWFLVNEPFYDLSFLFAILFLFLVFVIEARASLLKNVKHRKYKINENKTISNRVNIKDKKVV